REKVEVDVAHDDSVGVRIAHHRRRAIPTHQVNAIIGIAFHPWQNSLEKSRGMQTVGRESLLSFADENDGRFLRIRTEEPDNQIFAHEMRTKNPEGIGMRAGEKRL